MPNINPYNPFLSGKLKPTKDSVTSYHFQLEGYEKQASCLVQLATIA